MNIEELGLEIVQHPITKVKISHYKGKWYVEYRRKPKYFFDKWWWFDDGIYATYNDALMRTQILVANGCYETLGFSKKEFTVNS